MGGGRPHEVEGGAVTAGVVVPRLGGDQPRWRGEGPVGGRGCVGGGPGRPMGATVGHGGAGWGVAYWPRHVAIKWTHVH